MKRRLDINFEVKHDTPLINHVTNTFETYNSAKAKVLNNDFATISTTNDNDNEVPNFELQPDQHWIL